MAQTNRKPLTLADVDFEITHEQEDTAVRGNALASGDDEADREAEDEILSRLESGETHAWCTVIVVARYGNLEGRDVLGCVSVAREADLEDTIAEHEMRETAFAALEASRTLKLV